MPLTVAMSLLVFAGGAQFLAVAGVGGGGGPGGRGGRRGGGHAVPHAGPAGARGPARPERRPPEGRVMTWPAVLTLAAGTYLIRLTGLLLRGRVQVPASVERYLDLGATA